MSHHILIVDDQASYLHSLQENLRLRGYAVTALGNPLKVMETLRKSVFHCLLLDIKMPGKSGLELLHEVIAEFPALPIIMVSALSSDHHRMKGYESGADDYIAKPFNPELLLARLRAVVRRAARSPSLAYRRDNNVYRFACWRFDGRRSELTAEAGFQVALSRRETGLLKCLLANPFVALTREEIASAIEDSREAGAPPDANPGRAIDVLVGRLRTKLEGEPGSPQIIQTVRGAGYMLAVEVDISDAG